MGGPLIPLAGAAALAGVAWWLADDKTPPKPGQSAGKAAGLPNAPEPKTPVVIPKAPTAPITPIPAVPGFPSATEMQLARVTTNDPAPQGDLYIVPKAGAAGIPGVGAEKNGIVQVLNWDGGTVNGVEWSLISWGGGSRLKAVTGYAKRKYLMALPKGEEILK